MAKFRSTVSMFKLKNAHFIVDRFEGVRYVAVSYSIL